MNLCPRRALFVILLGCVSAAQANDLLHEPVFVDLAAQPLLRSLKDLSRQTHVSLGYDSKDCKGINAPRVHGIQTPLNALDTLLRDTGLHYEILDQRSLAILSVTDPAVAPKSPTRSKDAPAAFDPKPGDIRTSPGEVIVTGSHISGVLDQLAPKTTYSRRQMEESGAGSLDEFLSRLPQNLASNSSATYGVGDGQNGAHGSSVNLFGLGERGTLVLIDNHRAAPSAMGNFVDVSMIPLAAVERVEVLSQGAAAIYGADAVAGVVNIVLRRNFEGFESDVRDTWPDHSGAHQLGAAQTVGQSWDTGNLVSSLTYRRDDRLPSIDRSYSNTPGYALLPALTDYDGFLFVHQDLSPHLRADIDSLYSNRHTDDSDNYLLNGLRVGPLQQRGIANQYYFAPMLTWTSDSAWHAIADFDISQNRFAATTDAGGESASGTMVYSTLS